MSTARPTDWNALARDLTTARNAARAERHLHGRVLPQTRQRLDEALARASTAIVIHDAKARRAS